MGAAKFRLAKKQQHVVDELVALSLEEEVSFNHRQPPSSAPNRLTKPMVAMVHRAACAVSPAPERCFLASSTLRQLLLPAPLPRLLLPAPSPRPLLPAPVQGLLLPTKIS